MVHGEKSHFGLVLVLLHNQLIFSTINSERKMGQPGLVSWRALRFAACPVPKPGLSRFCEAQNIALDFKSGRKAKQLAFLCPKFLGQKLWGNLDLNQGPTGYESAALTTELLPQKIEEQCNGFLCR